MLGDLIVMIKRFIHQNFKCLHSYNIKVRNIGTQTFEIRECVKCGRIKTKRA